MKERPILFSAPMVRALLDGRKTQTRRIVKPQPLAGCTDYWRVLKSTKKSLIDTWVPRGGVPDKGGGFPVQGERVRCPYGIPGDRLWVRETWFDNMASDDGDEARTPARCVYRANGEFIDQFPEEYMDGKWTPSIHMPRWASRITLEVVDVRVERLQDISEADALAEGVEPKCLTCGENCIPTGGCGCCRPCYRESLIDIWLSINGPESWDANPWVWVVTFKRLEPKP